MQRKQTRQRWEYSQQLVTLLIAYRLLVFMATATKKEHKSARPERGGQATLLDAIRQGIWEEM